MTWYSVRKWGARCLAPLILIVLALSLLLPALAQAGGGIAISGNFYRQHFRLFPGESLSGPDIYLQVFNNSDTAMRVGISTQVPPGVELILSIMEFQLPPGGQQRVEVGIALSPEAVPGEYVLGITADSYPEGEGIMLAAAAKQQANLTIFGEAGSVSIVTLTPEGEPFRAVVRLYQQAGGASVLCGYSETGKLEMRLAPGDYLVQAYFEDTKVAEDSFTLAADEEKNITLTARTAFIVGFSAVPSYYIEGGELAFVKLVYTIKAIYQPLKDVEVILKVSFDGAALDEISVFSLNTLNTGNTAASYNNYIPPHGWEGGTYGFKLELLVGGELHAISPEEELEVTAPPAALMVSWAVLGGIIGAMLIIIAVIVIASVMLVRRRRALRSLGQR